MRDGLVPIEVSNAGGVTLPAGGDVLDWRKRSIIHKTWESKSKSPFSSKLLRLLSRREERDSSLDNNYSLERHHNYNGRPWCLGRDHFVYLLKRDLRPEHNFLDLGCGAMRTGVWVAGYLGQGRYFGIDAHRPGLEAAVRYEIPLHGLQSKRPRLLNNDCFDIGHFGVKFDWIFSFAVVNHLSDDLLDSALRNAHAYLKPSGRLVLSPAPRKGLEWIEGRYGFQLCHSEETPCLLIDDKIEWFEFRPIRP